MTQDSARQDLVKDIESLAGDISIKHKLPPSKLCEAHEKVIKEFLNIPVGSLVE